MATHFDAQRFVNDFVQSMNAKDPTRLLEHYAEDAELWDPTMPQPVRGKESIRENFEKWSSGFSDIEFNVKDLIQSGDKVAIYFEGKARHTGELELGPGERAPATNKVLKMNLGEFLTVSPQGKITKDHTLFDAMTMMVQLGLAPGPQQAGATKTRQAGTQTRGR